jgi:hypothetical protein
VTVTVLVAIAVAVGALLAVALTAPRWRRHDPGPDTFEGAMLDLRLAIHRTVEPAIQEFALKLSRFGAEIESRMEDRRSPRSPAPPDQPHGGASQQEEDS